MTRSRVTRMLTDRQVCGEYRPKGKSVTTDEVWLDHFPRVVDQELFDRVNAAAQARQSPAGRKSPQVSNLFSGKLRCGHCGGPMEFATSGASQTPFLRCQRVRLGGKCTNRTRFAYRPVEAAMLTACLHLALDDRAFTQAEELGRLTIAIAEKRREHEVATDRVGAFLELFAETRSAASKAKAIEAEKTALALADEIKELEAAALIARGAADSEAHLSRVAEIRRHLYSEDQTVRVANRLKVQQAFRTILHSMNFGDDRAIIVHLIGQANVLVIVDGEVRSRFNDDRLLRLTEKTEPLYQAMLKRA